MDRVLLKLMQVQKDEFVENFEENRIYDALKIQDAYFEAIINETIVRGR